MIRVRMACSMFGVPWSNCHCSANISGSEEELSRSWQLYAADSDSNQEAWSRTDNTPRAGCLTLDVSIAHSCFPRGRGQQEEKGRCRVRRARSSPSAFSDMILQGLARIGVDTSGFSCVCMCSLRGGITTAIEAGGPERVLWMLSGHAQDRAARQYVVFNFSTPRSRSFC